MFGFRVSGLGLIRFRFQGLRVSGLGIGYRVWGSGFRVWGCGEPGMAQVLPGLGFRALCLSTVGESWDLQVIRSGSMAAGRMFGFPVAQTFA